ncbi:peptidoglycan DD-metalloendopeptidase family protein [Flagellimonas meridianipacifica]|uniref:Peptidase M23-like protein n=1 Tax=Flagellimonas meridianipacifica TaxID=1080225 RepID=A0A2T0M9H7_9FLAO|nr:peptidoglycan DD-metalloendopeptidase family protein [Allomuricauda pacifica]PRX54129.1 peptidase M23-like protein [Allomuricauda pacifica]
MLEDFLKEHHPGPILDNRILLSDYVPLDISVQNKEIDKYEMTTPVGCQSYIDEVLEKEGKKVAFGGYLEQRGIYNSFGRFDEGEQRNIHLGMDFWHGAGTKVHVPIDGKVHSFRNNEDIGNYGPTIVLEHHFDSLTFYTLYGHLSLESLNGLQKGKVFREGETLATLGTPEINVNYAPHLHFQIIKDIQGYKGDYPGVCSQKELDFYKNNCPNPNLLLKMKI